MSSWNIWIVSSLYINGLRTNYEITKIRHSIVTNIVVSDNMQNENVVTKRYRVSDWLTNELQDLLEWLFATSKKYFNSKPYFQILSRFLSCSLIQNVKIDKYVRSRFPSNLFDISRLTTGIKWFHNNFVVRRKYEHYINLLKTVCRRSCSLSSE